MLKILARIGRSGSERATFLRFASVGGAISLIDVTVLYLLIMIGTSSYIARIPSYFAAMTVGYLLNRYFTFHHLERGLKLWRSLAGHYSVHAVGGLLNYGVYLLVLLVGEHWWGVAPNAIFMPLLAVWLGGMVGVCFNFKLSRKLVFAD